MSQYIVHHRNFYGKQPEDFTASMAQELRLQQDMLGSDWNLHTLAEGGSCLSPGTWIFVWASTAELAIYGMTDQPTTCPKCGCRTSFIDMPNTSPLRQVHTCNSVYCRFRFIAEDGD